MITIEFEDFGQDFLEWDIDLSTGKILDCRPFQATIWCKYWVLNPQQLVIGDRVHISDRKINPLDDEQDFLTINYSIESIIVHPKKHSLNNLKTLFKR